MSHEEWTWEQWCAAARRLDAKKAKAEVELVELLMDLEQRRSVWEGRGPSFAGLISSPNHLGLSLSGIRYENVKAALGAFARGEILRLGVPFACNALKIADMGDREKYRRAAEEWATEYSRPMSAQAALKLLREVAPRVPNVHRTLRQQLAEAHARILELEKELRQKEAVLGRTVAELRRARSLLRRHGIEFEPRQAAASV